ncbi:MAG: leucine-rich repeat protein [Dysgonamonadaceae bacterium]|jgi:hypothetical protein|nr:leucine-rich repeat protein [Dysgonamonadaceae bacterium]
MELTTILNKFRRIVNFQFSIFNSQLLPAVFLLAFSQMQAQEASGKFGENVTWNFSGETLTISGTGQMATYWNTADIPWRPYRYLIKAVVIEEGVTSIGNAAFYMCSALTSVTIPQTVTSLEIYVFAHCSALTSVTIPEHVESIGEFAFAYCPQLTSIICLNPTPPTLDRRGNIFLDSPISTATLYVPSGSAQAYEGWNFGNTVESIWGENNPFMWTLSSGVLTIRGTGEMPGYQDSWGNVTPWYPDRLSINAVVIEEGVTGIMDYAFYNCENMTSVTSLNPTPQSTGANVFDNVPLKDVTLYVPVGSAVTYKNDAVWGQFGKIEVNDAALSSLSVSPGIISPPFSPNNTNYTLALASSVSSIDITAAANHPNANVAGKGQKLISADNTAFVISVSAEGNVTKDYTVNVTRSPQKSDAYLSSLAPSAGTLTPPFNPYITDYTVGIADSISRISFTATSNRPNAKVPISGRIHSLTARDTTFNVSVFAEDEVTVKTYTVTVRRISHDATLKHLAVNAGTRPLMLTPPFDPDITDYSIDVENSVSNVTVEAEKNHARATVWGRSEYLLDAGETTKCNIIVRAEDELTMKYYTVNITRAGGGTGIPSAGAPAVPVYFHKQILHVDSPVAESVHIYSVTGTLLYRLEKPAGKTSFVINSPGQVVIVKGSSGWAEKLIINN